MSSKRFAIPLTLLLAAALLLPGGNLSSSGANASTGPAGQVLFIENAGQWPDAARFQVRGHAQQTPHRPTPEAVPGSVAGHESLRTTKLCDRANDAISLDELERILI